MHVPFFTKRLHYGLLALLELAKVYQAGGHVQMKAIASTHEIPEKFLVQVLLALRRGGFVSTVRGAKGGYKLAKPPSEIKVKDVAELLDGPPVAVENAGGPLAVVNLWKRVERGVGELLEVTLEEILFEDRRLSGRMFYQI
ncbi:MAG: hypothetical protein Kow0069_30140 [Promethearchaeota archaeon]